MHIIQDENSEYFSGYATIFNRSDQENDIFALGSFQECLSKAKISDIKLLWQHNHENIIGIYENIYEDNYGLFVRGKLLLDLAKGREVYTLIKNKAINGLSVGFNIQDFHYDKYSGARIITKAKLWEISLVTFPANNLAQINEIKNNPKWGTLIKIINKANTYLNN